MQRISEWYGPARFGLFYHWGLCTGGGSGDRRPEFNVPFKHDSVPEFEAAAGDPGTVARNMVDLAERVGARYIIYTLFATTDRFAVMYPTRLPGFLVSTTQDYAGALIEECEDRWNYAMGIGPTEEGKAPPMFEPMIETMSAFMAWASESVHNTTGGEGATLQKGWWNEGGFGSVTVSLADPKLLYLHVTTPPSTSRLIVQNNGGPVHEVLDLRTKQRQPFVNRGALNILQIDWSDVSNYGDKVFKVLLE